MPPPPCPGRTEYLRVSRRVRVSKSVKECPGGTEYQRVSTRDKSIKVRHFVVPPFKEEVHEAGELIRGDAGQLSQSLDGDNCPS